MINQAIEVPNVMFQNRKIFVESHGILDKTAQRDANVLGRIMGDMLKAKQAVTEPIVTEIIMGG